jgi:Putative Ig domain
LSALCNAQSRAVADLRFQTSSLPNASIGRPYSAPIVVTGGTPPLEWKLIQGRLPPGISLQSTSGILSGSPTAPGNYNFTVTVFDTTPKTITANFTIRVEDYLVVRWKTGPTLSSNVVSGTVEVANNSRDIYDQTVIIVAVNEIGKAFALGYQHFDLPPQGQQVIPYSSSLPNGYYVVNVDAVAEIKAANVIRRDRLQTQQPIRVNVNR